MSQRVLVLRPEPGASATAEALRRMGFEPLVLPLTVIQRLTPVFAPSVEHDAVIVTSANALRHAPPGLLGALARLPVFAVGDATARAATAAGLADVEAAAGDAVSLSRLVRERLRAGSRVVYLCGRVRRPEFEATMRRANIQVEAVEIYDTIATAVTAEDMAEIANRGVHAVLVHSTESALALVRLATAAGGDAIAVAASCVAISQRAAEPVRAAGVCRDIVVAREPSEEAMLEALATL